MPRKRRVARGGAKVGAKIGSAVAPRAARLGGRAALKAGRGQAKLARAAMSSREPAASRYMKYALFALAGLALGAMLARSRSENGASSGFTGATGHHAPDAGSPAGRRGETWGSGTPTGTAGGSATHQSPSEANRTGAERDYSDPSTGPLIGEQHAAKAGDVPVQQEEIENRIRTLIGEDSRTANMPRLNVEVNDGIAELRGPAPSQEAREAAGEIAMGVDGVGEVRNLIVVD